MATTVNLRRHLRVLMECGCVASGIIQSKCPKGNGMDDASGFHEFEHNVCKRCGQGETPVCASCYGIKPGSSVIARKQPDLTGRWAFCVYNNKHGNCRSMTESSLELAFFEFLAAEPFDQYYCGCRGWE